MKKKNRKDKKRKEKKCDLKFFNKIVQKPPKSVENSHESEVAEVTEVKRPRKLKQRKFLMKTCKD
jgi:hypothetical protein